MSRTPQGTIDGDNGRGVPLGGKRRIARELKDYDDEPFVPDYDDFELEDGEADERRRDPLRGTR